MFTLYVYPMFMYTLVLPLPWRRGLVESPKLAELWVVRSNPDMAWVGRMAV
jgi:hypothetical protein